MLAVMLEKFDLDYILLEAYHHIAFPVGASISPMPNREYILDQLGYYEALEAIAQDPRRSCFHIQDGGRRVLGLKHAQHHQQLQ